MNYNRRTTLMLGLGTAAAAVLPLPVLAAVEDDIAAFTGGAEVTTSDAVVLNAPEIAENGNTVPISVSAPGAVAIAVLAAGNPAPLAATFNFGPLSATQSAGTRIRLARTQDVIAIAKMPDGSFVQTSQEVKVTIGGCGG